MSRPSMGLRKHLEETLVFTSHAIQANSGTLPKAPQFKASGFRGHGISKAPIGMAAVEGSHRPRPPGRGWSPWCSGSELMMNHDESVAACPLSWTHTKMDEAFNENDPSSIPRIWSLIRNQPSASLLLRLGRYDRSPGKSCFVQAETNAQGR